MVTISHYKKWKKKNNDFFIFLPHLFGWKLIACQKFVMNSEMCLFPVT